MILVTGGTGLIGRDGLRLLSQAGVPARALARNPQKGEKLPGITWVAGDLASKRKSRTLEWNGPCCGLTISWRTSFSRRNTLSKTSWFTRLQATARSHTLTPGTLPQSL